ncbi:MAG: sulfatase-like hydrolase/transferase [Planctomycetes bacterium]|nr:sulfatase-like hydrolase/transferase [Planctomycetota bacterium]
MRPSSILALTLLAGSLAGACGGAAPPARANLVLILADDLGAGDVGWTGLATEPIPTPNLDRLVRSGVALDQFRSAPLCTPARAAFLTGMAPARLGLLRNISQRDAGGLSPEAPTLAEVLRAAGYATGLVGKWHLGHAAGSLRPNARGFERFHGVRGGWIDHETHARGTTRDWWRDEEPLVETGHDTRLLASAAARAIEERDRARPFYLQLAFTTPHAPTAVPAGRSLAESAAAGDATRRAYALLVDELDRGVGLVLDALEREGLREHTLVVFASDNGAPLAYGGSNGVLRGAKGSVYDGALRVPALLSWPGRLAPGRSALAMQATDLAPTVCQALSVPFPAASPRDGVSLWDALADGEAPPERVAVFGVERADGTSWAAFDGRWKLVDERGGPAPALYDLRADPSEERDLAAAEPGVRARLEAALVPWRALPHLPFEPDEGPRR